MSNICYRYKCPIRVTIGKENDDDVIDIICPKCEKLLFVSDTRSMKTKRRLKIFFIYFFVIIGLMLTILIFKNSIIYKYSFNKTPDKLIIQFFNYLNNADYLDAFYLTDNQDWQPYQTFKKRLSICNNISIKSIKGKSYYSIKNADTILNVVYMAIINDTVRELDFDFHMKMNSKRWKIISCTDPRDPNIDALTKDEIPPDAKNAINTFFKFIDRGLCYKAFLLTTFKEENEFLDRCNCFEYFTIKNVRKLIGKDEYEINIKYMDICKDTVIKKESQLIKMIKTDYWRVASFEGIYEYHK